MFGFLGFQTEPDAVCYGAQSFCTTASHKPRSLRLGRRRRRVCQTVPAARPDKSPQLSGVELREQVSRSVSSTESVSAHRGAARGQQSSPWPRRCARAALKQAFPNICSSLETCTRTRTEEKCLLSPQGLISSPSTLLAN